MVKGKCVAEPTPVRRRKQQKPTGTGRSSTSAIVLSPSLSSADRMAGQLSLLLTMPMDVFFEVASHLKPLDILHLSRVSNTFRKLLLSRSSRRIWAAARKNMVPEIPDGPDDVSEPLYARLLFERYCMTCGAADADQVDYANVHRYCSGCWYSSLQAGGQLLYNSGFYYDPDFKKVVYDLLSPAPDASYPQLAPQSRNTQVTGSNNTEHTMFHHDSFVALAEEYRQVCAGETNMSVEQFIEKHRTRTQKRLLFQTEIMTVEFDRRQARATYGYCMTDRKLAIEEKLRELDYEPEDYPVMDAEFHALLQPRAALTPRIWNNIKPQLLDMLQAERARRVDEAFHIKWFMRMQDLQPLYENFVQTIKERYSEDVWMRTMPAFEAAVKLPSLRALLASASPLEHVSHSDFAGIRSALWKDVRDAMIKIQRHCANMLREAACGTVPASSSQGKRVGKDAGTDKGKGKACDCVDEPVESDINIDDLYADDPAAADRALLEQPTSLFECAHPNCLQVNTPGLISVNSRAQGVMTFLGVLQHDATFHPSPSWDAIPVRVAENTMRNLVPRLFDALSLPQNTRLSELHEQLCNGIPARCSCGVSFQVPHMMMPLFVGESMHLTYLLQHISGTLWSSLAGLGYGGMYGANASHHITLDPRPGGNSHAQPGQGLGGAQVQLPGGGAVFPIPPPIGGFPVVQPFGGAFPIPPPIGGALHIPPPTALHYASGQGGLSPLGVMQWAQRLAQPGMAQFEFDAPGVPVGLLHPYVQKQMQALAAMLNQPNAGALEPLRALLRARKRRS
ncbi:hypothetical protein L226DRAFT_488685 [Lentinus tigrinus ALCF2SS1-7]|uniref:F-box domain-containing protein n=1 Tax=Lentinus tigrinus ALCF2SS1-6 TaxID=1328759 RepID=A0A5C2S779_9APHY|nr:hypothetical protein L227DRAFT_654184 [Lentinus tigrinus ALCF2SS1-6]RPD73496.1 hypothetical protein L226DRAFT_488685 [Lentinus tigrinus ALCF2SS1-7]